MASAHAPLFVSSTAARAYAQDPGTGAMLPFAVAPEYFDVPAGAQAGDALAYSAVPDEFADAYTGEHTAATRIVGADYGERRSFTLVGSAVAAIFIVGVAALVVSLAISIRPTAGVRPDPGHNIVAPTQQPAARWLLLRRRRRPLRLRLPVPPAPAPVAVPAPAPVPAPVAVPAPAPVPVPAAPAPVPAPAPAAPFQCQFRYHFPRSSVGREAGVTVKAGTTAAAGSRAVPGGSRVVATVAAGSVAEVTAASAAVTVASGFGIPGIPGI